MDDRATREAAADLIDGAIDIIHERGLSCRGTYDDTQHPCVVAACSEANAYQHSPAWFVATHAIQDECGDRAIGAWSDSSPVEDVVLTMKRASASLREVTA